MRSERQTQWQTLHLHRDAPPKPAVGAPCNGCGVCCAAAPCPAGMIVFRRRQGPCPALRWSGERYCCGLVAEPGRHLRWLPARWARPLFLRWIAAGIGCDSDASPHSPTLP